MATTLYCHTSTAIYSGTHPDLHKRDESVKLRRLYTCFCSVDETGMIKVENQTSGLNFNVEIISSAGTLAKVPYKFSKQLWTGGPLFLISISLWGSSYSYTLQMLQTTTTFPPFLLNLQLHSLTSLCQVTVDGIGPGQWGLTP